VWKSSIYGRKSAYALYVPVLQVMIQVITEDGGSIFFQNVGDHLQGFMGSQSLFFVINALSKCAIRWRSGRFSMFERVSALSILNRSA
jgi:hypothetical protein